MEKRCPKCGGYLPKNASFCMHCCNLVSVRTVPANKEIKPKKTKWLILSSAIVLLAVVCIIYGNSKTQSNKTVQEHTVVTVSEFAETSQSTSETTAKETTATTSSTTKAAETVPSTVPSTEEVTSALIIYETAEQTTEQKTTVKTKKTTKKPTGTKQDVEIQNGTLISYPKNKKTSIYTIPYSVKSIKKGAFRGNKYIKKLKFSKRENVKCDWNDLFSSLPNLKTIYIYAGTNADTEGMQYFGGEIVYYYD